MELPAGVAYRVMYGFEVAGETGVLVGGGIGGKLVGGDVEVALAGGASAACGIEKAVFH